MRHIALLTTLLCGWLSCAHASHSPARLLEGKHSIEELLRIPKGLKPGRYTVHCEALVLKSGLTDYFACYLMTASAPYSLKRAVVSAGRRARFAPATRNGAPADVYVVLMVLVDTRAGDPLVLATPNNGVEAARYGLLYTAPQRFSSFRRAHKFMVGDILNDLWIWQKLWIDERGKVTKFVLTNASRAPQWLVDEIEQDMEKMEFMPGFFEGKPVPMLYAEPIFSRDP